MVRAQNSKNCLALYLQPLKFGIVDTVSGLRQLITESDIVEKEVDYLGMSDEIFVVAVGDVDAGCGDRHLAAESPRVHS